MEEVTRVSSVWQQPIKGTQKLVLLALADNAVKELNS
jgi:hypothetical protein